MRGRSGYLMVLVLGLVLVASVRAPARRSEPYDLVLVGGRVLDGTGNPWFYADVAIRGDRIAAVSDLGDAPARRRIDVRGRFVVPGFIDIHSHADGPRGDQRGLRSDDPKRRAAPNLVAQGITTVVVNPDGRSAWPIAQQKAELERKKTGPNVILLVGHNTVRRMVLKTDYQRPATPDEIAAMRRLVRQGMEEGAWGLSAGLEYVPGRWSTTDEVVALVEEIVPYGGVYIAHQRSEGADPMWYWPSQHPFRPPSLLDAVRETIEIGEQTGATVVASHIKAKGAYYWGSSHAAIRLIAAARARGVDVWADQYPYDTTGSDGRTVLIPHWLFAGLETREGETEPPDFMAVLKKALQDPATAARIRRDIAHEIARRGGADRIVVFDYPNQDYIGRTLQELADQRRVSPVDMAIALQLEGDPHRPGGGRLRGFSLWEGDIEAYMKQPWTITCTDAGVALPGDGPVHARFYGTYPRKLRRYALDRGVITLEHAVRSSTSLPAQVLGLRDRGLIRAGMYADIVVFDPQRVRDTATFFEPHQYPEGIEYVLVNGQFVVENGRLTYALPGRVLTPPRRR